jgi:hypothetical protein
VAVWLDAFAVGAAVIWLDADAALTVEGVSAPLDALRFLGGGGRGSSVLSSLMSRSMPVSSRAAMFAMR